MKKTINTIKLTEQATAKYPTLANYTHVKFSHGGVILLTNKNKAFHIPKLFIRYQDVELLTFN
jgi:hypothetical protein